MSEPLLKEQFVIETVPGRNDRISMPFTKYPTPDEIKAFMLSINWKGAVQVHKHMYLSSEEELQAEDDEKAEDELGGTIRNLEDSFSLMQALEVKIGKLYGHMREQPKQLVLSARQGRMMIPYGMFTAPPTRYKGIPIIYVDYDLDEPLLCW